MRDDPSSGTRRAAITRAVDDAWLLTAFEGVDAPRAQWAAEIDAASAWEALLAAGVDETAIVAMAVAHTGAERALLADLAPEVAGSLPRAMAVRYQVCPLRLDGSTLLVATANPNRLALEQDLEFASGRRVRLLVATPAEVRAARAALYEGGALPAAASPAPRPGDAPAAAAAPQTAAVQIVERMVGEALTAGASDVHIEPSGPALLVRFRVDGALYDAMRVPAELAPLVVSRLKIAAGLDIADRVRPQDGRTSTQFAGRSVDLRVSTLPLGGAGEKVVLRLLDSRSAATDLAALGFTPAELHRVHKQLVQTEGLVLVTGPTGSGKTTTLYSALRHVHKPESNIVTVEDPIEYRLEGINQVQTNDRAGLTFASALRSILRQDPDVVLVGEIRDAETTGIAIKASMTGHLVLSTLHTNDAVGAVGRLAELGAEPGALAGALKAVVAQRLVRRLCPDCSRPVALHDLPPDHQLHLAGRATARLREPVGCGSCRGTGFRGRMVVAEVLVVTPDVQRAIARGADASELGELAARGGMHTLWESGIARVLAGTTSFHELIDSVVPPAPSEADAPAGQDGVDAILARLQPGAPPAAPAAATAAAPPAAPGDRGAPVLAHDAAGAPPRVLVVDEDRAARLELRAALELDGFAVIEACDGAAALQYAERLRPDVVVTELALPRLDGIGLLQALAALAEPPQAFVRTAQSDAALLAWACESGAVAAVGKEVDPRMVVARLQAALSRAA